MSVFIRLIITFTACISILGCSTGIESTKTITLSRYEKKQMEPTPEEKLLADIEPVKLRDWQPGKCFLVADKRVALVFDAATVGPEDENLEGVVLEYAGTASKPTPGGLDELVVLFRHGNRVYRYSTGKGAATGVLTSGDVPMLIDMDIVARVDSLLKGRKVWTLSQLWYDRAGNKLRGRKFVPVTIDSVVPGTMVFPLRIDVTDSAGQKAMFYMNVSNAGIESRTFRNLFSLSDPHDKYPTIDPEEWELIKDGKVRLGMTKDECKLSLGNPSDVDSVHDWNSTIDFWQYSNGTFLRFSDGLLVDFRN